MAVPPGPGPQGRPQPRHQGAAQYVPPPPGHRPHGRPPQGRPPYGPPAYPQVPPGYRPPPHGAPPRQGPPPRKSNTGRIVAIVVGVLVALLALGGFAVFQLVSGVAERVGGATEGLATSCDAVPTDAVNTALGGSYEVIQLGGVGALAAPILDSRVLPDALSCWAVETGDEGRLARIARYSGADAAQRFAAEKTRAMGVTEDRGNGLSVSSEGYFGGDVTSGDQAFCTSGDFSGSAGALVRRGELLVYVSTTAAGEGAGALPQIDITADQLSFATDEANCTLAVALAEKVR